MNKFINILLLLIIIPFIGYSLFVGFDLPIEMFKVSGANSPHQSMVFIIFSFIFFIILFIRSINRWLGIRMVNQIQKFQWNVVMDNSRVKQVVLYLVLEAIIHFFLAFSLFQITAKTLPVDLILLFFGLDHLLLAFFGKALKKFRVGITSKAILAVDRDTKVVYFSGIKEISQQQQSLFFDYINNLQLSLPSDAISRNDVDDFKLSIEKNLNRDKVYFAESFKAF